METTSISLSASTLQNHIKLGKMFEDCFHPGDVNKLRFVVNRKQDSRTYYMGQVFTKCVA
jgi:hypothetical protein